MLCTFHMTHYFDSYMDGVRQTVMLDNWKMNKLQQACRLHHLKKQLQSYNNKLQSYKNQLQSAKKQQLQTDINCFNKDIIYEINVSEAQKHFPISRNGISQQSFFLSCPSSRGTRYIVEPTYLRPSKTI